MSKDYCPKTFWELVSIMDNMPYDDCVENDDTGKTRRAIAYNGEYELYEADDNDWVEYVRSTDDVIEAAQFIAEGWDVYEDMKSHFYGVIYRAEVGNEI